MIGAAWHSRLEKNGVSMMLQDDVIHVSRLLRAAHGLKGATMADQLRYGGRLLPRRVRQAAQRLAHAEKVLGMPKLARQLDVGALSADYKMCVQYLRPMSQGATVQSLWMRALSWAAWMMVAVLAMIMLLFWFR